LNSLDVKHYNENTNRLIQLLKNEDNIEFNYTVLSTSKADPSFEPSIDTVDSFILYYGGNSPVRSLNNFNEVPLYLLPPTSEHKTNYSNINSWKRNYEAIYHLWFRGEIDEDYFYSQLSNFDSSLTKQGMKISRLISSLTSKECYYYLYQYPGEEENVINKVCPSCSESWRLEDKLFDLFEFKCQKCKIIS
jgi:predicted  nucleic acid-binding Zn ribbon protein